MCGLMLQHVCVTRPALSVVTSPVIRIQATATVNLTSCRQPATNAEMASTSFQHSASPTKYAHSVRCNNVCLVTCRRLCAS